jgi:biotin carboxyl carrier protein
LGTHRLVIEGREYQVDVGARRGNRVRVTVDGRAYDVELSDGRQRVAPAPAGASPALAPAPGGGSGDVRAPISGLVLSVAVTEGQRVTAGTVVLVLEAMKMENEVFAPIDGVVTKVRVAPQQEVAQGDPLIVIEAG